MLPTRTHNRLSAHPRNLPVQRLSRLGTVVVVVVAVALATFGVSEVVRQARSQPESGLERVATLNGLVAQIENAGWLDMSHDGAPTGFQMPAAMMPGMPTGDNQRLAIRLVLQNSAPDARDLHPASEFSLRSAGGKQWTAVGTSFGELPRLGTGNAVTGSLYFDLVPQELAAAPFWLDWEQAGGHQRLAIPVTGAAPAHAH